MKIDYKDVLKFLFPEWQVIEIIKKDGFIAKKQKNQVNTNDVQMVRRGENTSVANEQTTNMGTTFNAQVPKAVCTPVNVSKSEKIIKPNIVDEKFDGLEEQLSQEIIADKNYIKSLCIWNIF